MGAPGFLAPNNRSLHETARQKKRYFLRIPQGLSRRPTADKKSEDSGVKTEMELDRSRPSVGSITSRCSGNEPSGTKTGLETAAEIDPSPSVREIQ